MSKLVNELYYGQTVNSKSRCLTYCVVAVSENRHLNNCINFSEKTRLSEGNKTGTCSPTPFLLGFFYNIYKKKKDIYAVFFFHSSPSSTKPKIVFYASPVAEHTCVIILPNCQLHGNSFFPVQMG